jgi:hypothetical protein
MTQKQTPHYSSRERGADFGCANKGLQGIALARKNDRLDLPSEEQKE